MTHEELSGITSSSIINGDTSLNLIGATIVENQHDGKIGIQCTGNLQRTPDDEYSVENSFRDGKYIGASIDIDDVKDYKYLVFYGKKLSGYGQPMVMLFDEQGEKVGEISAGYQEIDDEWHQYLIDISEMSGTLRVVFNGGYIDNSGDKDSSYMFSDVTLY